MAEVLGNNKGLNFIRTRNNPAKDFLWYLTLGKFKPAAQSYMLDYLEDNFSFCCQRTSIPAVDTAAIIIPWQGQESVYSAKRTFDHNLGVSIMEVENGAIGRVLYRWLQMCSSNYDGSCLSRYNEYALSVAHLIRLNEERQIVAYYNLYNVWLKTVSSANLDQGGSNLIVYDVTLSYDYWELGDSNGNIVGFRQAKGSTQGGSATGYKVTQTTSGSYTDSDSASADGEDGTSDFENVWDILA